MLNLAKLVLLLSTRTAALGNRMRNWRNNADNCELRLTILLTHGGCFSAYVNYKTCDDNAEEKFISALRKLVTYRGNEPDADSEEQLNEIAIDEYFKIRPPEVASDLG